MTAAELQRRITALEARLRDIDLDRQFVLRELDMCRDHLRLLQLAGERIMVRTMNVDTTTERPNRRGRRPQRDHLALAALYAQDRTVTSIAKELGEIRPRVDSWMRGKPKDARPIPSRCRIYLRVKYGIPDAAWAKTAPPEPGDAAWLRKRGIDPDIEK